MEYPSAQKQIFLSYRCDGGRGGPNRSPDPASRAEVARARPAGRLVAQAAPPLTHTTSVKNHWQNKDALEGEGERPEGSADELPGGRGGAAAARLRGSRCEGGVIPHLEADCAWTGGCASKQRVDASGTMWWSERAPSSFAFYARRTSGLPCRSIPPHRWRS